MTSKSLWRWQGITSKGEQCNGGIWADNRDDAAQHLFAREITLLSLHRLRVQTKYWHIQFVIQFVRQIATLLQVGVTLADGMNLMAQQHPILQWRALLEYIARQLLLGESLSDTLRTRSDIFSSLFVAIIQTGEVTGKLEECCHHLAKQQEEYWQLKKKVQKALRYPGFITAIAILITAGMLGFVLPEFAAIYKTFNTPLPSLTRVTIRLADVIARQGIYLIAIVPGIATGMLLLRRHNKVQTFWQAMLLRIPLAGELIRSQRLSQLYTVLTLTQQAGIPLLDGLQCARNTLPVFFWRPAIARIGENVANGGALWSAVQQENIFSPWCTPLIRTGEMSGTLDIMLQRLAVMHTERARELADGLAAWLEPVIMMVMGCIIGTLVLAMYLPIFHLGDAMSAG